MSRVECDLLNHLTARTGEQVFVHGRSPGMAAVPVITPAGHGDVEAEILEARAKTIRAKHALEN